MRILVTTIAIATVTLALPVVETAASTRHPRHRIVAHHRAYGPQPRFVLYRQYYEPAAPYYRNSQEPPPLPFVPRDNSDASIILRATIRAQAEPGVTSELAPDAKQTATGGPVGGVPGLSGGGGGR